MIRGNDQITTLEAQVSVLQLRHDLKQRDYLALVKTPRAKRSPDYARQCAILSAQITSFETDLRRARQWLESCKAGGQHG